MKSTTKKTVKSTTTVKPAPKQTKSKEVVKEKKVEKKETPKEETPSVPTVDHDRYRGVLPPKMDNTTEEGLKKWLVFPREDLTWREFATVEEANKFKASKKSNGISVGLQCGSIYRVTFWEHFDTAKDMIKDMNERVASKPAYVERVSAIEMQTDEEANEALKKKLSKERKPREKKDKKKK